MIEGRARVLAKIGGAGLEDVDGRVRLARAVRRARAHGHEVILVHGGGNQMRTVCRRLGIADRYHDGLRVTDAQTAEAAVMVLGGLVNRQLVAALEDAGVPAAGLTGADGSTFTAAKHVPEGVDLGFVGEVAEVDAGLVETLLARGFTPVLATIAPPARAARGDRPGLRQAFYNVNADMAAGPLARAFAADALLFLTDVPAVLDERGRPIRVLTPARCEELLAAGVLRGGMIPKVRAALAALAGHPTCLVKIAPAAGHDPIRDALAEDAGTLFHVEDSPWTST